MSSRNQSIGHNKLIGDSSSQNFSTNSASKKSKSSMAKTRSQNSDVKVNNIDDEASIEQSKIGVKESSVKDAPASNGHLEIGANNPGKNPSLTSSAVSSIDLDVGQMKNLNDSINLYRDDFGMQVKTEAVNIHSTKTQSTVISNASNTHSKSARHTIKVKNYEKNLIKNLVQSMKNLSVFNVSPIVSPIDAIEQLNQEFVQMMKCYSLGSRDELKCGVCCVDNLNFKQSFFCKQQLESPVQLTKSQSTLNLKELAYKINSFNPFENCAAYDSEFKSQTGLKNYKSDESMYTTSECSRLNDSNESLKLKYFADEKLDMLEKNKSVRIKKTTSKQKEGKLKANYDFVRFKPLPVCKDLNGNLVLSLNLPENRSSKHIKTVKQSYLALTLIILKIMANKSCSLSSNKISSQTRKANQYEVHKSTMNKSKYLSSKFQYVRSLNESCLAQYFKQSIQKAHTLNRINKVNTYLAFLFIVTLMTYNFLPSSNITNNNSVTKWLQDLRMMSENECLCVLQAKSLSSKLSQLKTDKINDTADIGCGAKIILPDLTVHGKVFKLGCYFSCYNKML
ncbi:hypothetical protein BpHYR1_030462 [Brachionus plicatilis]|uniref:Protein inscuteable homologue LGN-binding domain-containing protein n=1 Tax=Brachionus plicatilis TaxID=10195 RepID=A0A3M7RWE5_BRAPC|nr:hypothetical protein BpHYR1_030462 [Brachionus plicatilis]